MDDILQNAAVVLDGLDRANVVIVACHQYLVVSKLVVSEMKRQAKNRRGMSLAPEFGNDDVANVTTDSEKKVVERVPDRHTPEDSFAFEGKQECRWNVIRRKIHAARSFFEYFEIATEGHSLFVIVKEIRDFWCGRTMCPQEFAFFIPSRPAKDQRLGHGNPKRILAGLGETLTYGST